ncbi:MAG: glycosyltransferase [Clostridia bacterium]|nr:glycosyltransferase [Clostridia bacterium]
MKIGLFIDTFYPMVDGVIKVVDNYARELSKTDDVTVFCPLTDKNVQLELPYKIVPCRMMPWPKTDYGIPMPAFSPAFKKALKESDLDVVHIHSPFTVGRQGLKYAKKHNIPSVATIHSQFDQDIAKSVKRGGLFFKIALGYIFKTFESVDKLYAVNKITGEHFNKDLGLKKECEVLPNASVILPVIDPLKAEKLVNDRFKIKEGQSVYLFVGRLDFIKNLDFLIRAIAVLKERGRDFKMLFVGEGHDHAALSSLVCKLGLSENVTFCGKITEKHVLAAVYERAKLFLFPSLYDSSSLVQIEAAGQKTPTVFIKGSITSSTTTDNVNAFLSDNDPTAFAEKIIQIENDDELYKKVQEGAKRDLFITWEQAIKNVREIYEQAIDQAKR